MRKGMGFCTTGVGAAWGPHVPAAALSAAPRPGKGPSSSPVFLLPFHRLGLGVTGASPPPRVPG